MENKSFNDIDSNNVNEDGKSYLLDEKQFFKYHHLLKERTNLKFIQKFREKQLIHSKKFFPISFFELNTIKKYLQEEKLKENIPTSIKETEKDLEANEKKEEKNSSFEELNNQIHSNPSSPSIIISWFPKTWLSFINIKKNLGKNKKNELQTIKQALH